MKKIANKVSAEPVLDMRYLETLTGYNARRVALKAIGLFSSRMIDFGLSPVDFSVLSLIGHNPGVTSRQLCRALNILPPILSARSARWSSAASSNAARIRKTAAPSACT